MDLIDREELRERSMPVREFMRNNPDLHVVSVNQINKMPTIDAEPVRLRVEKVDIVESNGWYRKRFYCPCGQLIRTEAWDEKRCFGQGTILKENVMPHYCPNCGAKMDLEVQDG